MSDLLLSSELFFEKTKGMLFSQQGYFERLQVRFKNKLNCERFKGIQWQNMAKIKYSIFCECVSVCVNVHMSACECVIT